MSEILKNYIRNQIYSQEQVLKNKITLPNGKIALSRYFYVKLKKYAVDFVNYSTEPKIVAMSGLRGVGKTTLLASLYFEKELNYNYKIYFSVDELFNILGSSIYNFLDLYQELIGIRFENTQQKFLILIDEIHFDPNWAQILKTIYDKYSNVFVVCTGSSALALNSTTDLARRMIITKIHPLCFTEYIQIGSRYINPDNTIFPIKGLKQELKHILFQSTSFEIMILAIKNQKIQEKADEYYAKFNPAQIDNYVKYGTMPNNLILPTGDNFDLTNQVSLNNQLLDRIIEKDFVEFGNFKQETIQKTKNLLLLLATKSDLSINSLSKTLSISNLTIQSILESLEKCDLIIKILPFGNPEKKIVKPSKYYFSSPVFRLARLYYFDSLNPFDQYKGLLLEDIVAQILTRELSQIANIFNDPNSGNADFIIQTIAQKKIALEVGYGKKGKEQPKKSMTRFNLDYGIVVSNDQYCIWQEDKIVRIPLKWFLLL